MRQNNKLMHAKTLAFGVLFLFTCFFTTYSFAQTGNQAKQILDKTASVLSRKGGASANFQLSNAKMGQVSGTIAIKGNKFHAATPQAIVWFNGKTQWTYLKKTEEVNVTTPTQAQQMMMNPYTFINIYKTGYVMTASTGSNAYEVHLKAQNAKRTVQEMYITVDKKTYVPLTVKMRQQKAWTTIRISNFKGVNQPDRLFVFNSKEFPGAEVIDLR